MNKKTIAQADVGGKRVLVRVDFNVPLNAQGEVSDLTRIKASLPTIEYLANQKAKVIILSHLGQPKGEYKPELTMQSIAVLISKLMDRPVEFVESKVCDPHTQEVVNAMQESEIIMLENLRFDIGEEKNEERFIKQLAQLGDLYVNDAFGTCHRKHASIYGIGAYLPTYGGFLMEKELEFMGEALKNPEHEFTAIIGGAKVSSKIGVINHLLEKVDNLLIGGGMAFTFLKAMGYEIGKSLLDEDRIEYSRDLMHKAKELGVNLMIPTDILAAEAFSNDARSKVVLASEIPPDYIGLDIGPNTADAFEQVILRSKTIIWNGPMGAFELPKFAQGTHRVAQAMSQCTGMTIVGGGDSAAAIDQFGMQGMVSHISTGGGASLEFLEGKVLPGVSIIIDKEG